MNAPKLLELYSILADRIEHGYSRTTIQFQHDEIQQVAKELEQVLGITPEEDAVLEAMQRISGVVDQRKALYGVP